MSEKLHNNETALTQVELISRAMSEGRVYKKTATTKARPLTQKDFEERGGTIATKEGSVTFQVGDYLAIGIDGEEWPIPKAKMEHTKRLVRTEVGEDGVEWGVYENTNTVHAIQINQPFHVELESGDRIFGKAGDYFVYDGSSCWITDKEIFESTYTESKTEDGDSTASVPQKF